MNQAIEIIECPICMDEIDGEKNKVITECGHCFHTSCLMKNVVHNGFGCPYCRNVMAEEPADDNSDEEYDEYSVDEEGPDYNDNVLQGARWLFQRAEGEDIDDEEDSVLDEDEEVVEEQVDRPSVDYIVERLVQNGVTMSDLVKTVLLFDHDEFENEESFERGDSELFGKFRIIISNFQPAVAVVEDECICRYETSHYQSSRLRQHDSVEEEEDTFYSSERASRYERMDALVQTCKKEEQSVQMPFSFQIKGSCRRT
jgi:hypothetical protein